MGGAIIMLTKGMDEPTYGLLSPIAFWRPRLVQCILHRIWALNGSVLLRDGIPNLATAFLMLVMVCALLW